MSCSFPKSLKILKRTHFKWLCYKHQRLVGNLFIVDIKKNSLDFSRLGITVTKKFGKSHERNRFKRLVREAFRCHRGRCIVGYDMNIRPKSSALHVKVADIICELISLVGTDESRRSQSGNSES